MAERRSVLGVGDMIAVPDIPGSKFADLDHFAVAIPASNSYAVCVPYAQARAAPKNGDRVWVRRTRVVDGLHEDTLRVVKIERKKVRLECQEPIPKSYKGKVVFYPSSRRCETVEIRGLVVGWYESMAKARKGGTS
jgi:hypothetical protein